MTSKPSVRILFLAANPSETSRLALDEEMHSINQRLRSSGVGPHVELCAEWAMRADELPAALMRHRPRIVHFSGHGSSTGELYFVGELPGTMGPVSAETLQHIFQTLPGDICCVVLNACYSSIQATALATVLPCVVGMSRAVQDRAASAFAAGFYEALVFGESVKTAFNIGCAQIELAQAPDQRDVPQLLLRTGIDANNLHLIPREDVPPPPIATSIPLIPAQEIIVSHLGGREPAPPIHSLFQRWRLMIWIVCMLALVGASAVAWRLRSPTVTVLQKVERGVPSENHPPISVVPEAVHEDKIDTVPSTTSSTEEQPPARTKSAPVKKRPAKRAAGDSAALDYRGVLVDEELKQPIEGAIVLLLGTECENKTTQHGVFQFQSCDPDGVKRLRHPSVSITLPSLSKDRRKRCPDIPLLKPPAITRIDISEKCRYKAQEKGGGSGSK